MKIYKMTTLFTFFITSFLIFGYIDPLGDMTMEDVRADVRRIEEQAKIAEIEEQMNLGRSPRESMFMAEEPVEARLIMYVDPVVKYGQQGEVELIEAIKYKYEDGTTEIITYDGEVLKGR